MAGRLGALVIEIEARTAKLKSDMGRAERLVKISAQKIKVASQAASNALSKIGIGAAAGTVALAALYKKTSENIDETAKFADVIGLTTEQLSGYRLAANITGSEIGQLNTGLTRLQKNIGDAEAGLATAVREFDRLGIAVSDLRGLSTDEQIKLIADRFKQLPSTIDRSSVALNLFGRSGISLSKLLNEGSEGINRFQQEAKDLGLAFSRVDAAKIEEANDAFTRAQAISTGFANSLTIELAPVIQAVTESFIDAGKEAGGFGNIAREGIDNVAYGIGVMADGLHGIDILYTGLKAASHEWVDFTLGNILKLDAAILEFAEKTLGLVGIEFEKLTKTRALFEGLSEQITLNKEAIETELQGKLLEELPSTGIENALKRVRDESQKAAEEIVRVQELAAAAASKNVTFVDFSKPDVKRKKLPTDVSERLKEGAALYDATRTPLEKYNITLERYQELLDHGSISQETFNRGLEQAKDAFNDTDPLFKQIEELSQRTEDVLLDGISNAIGGVKDWEKQFIASLAKIALEAAALKIFGPSSTSGGLGGIVSSGLKSLFSFDGGGYTGPGSRSGGVDGRGGFPAILHPNETVVDHSRGQGLGVVQNFNIAAPEPAKFHLSASRAALEGRRRLDRVG